MAGAHTIAVEGVDVLLGPNSTLSPVAAALDEYGAFILKQPARPLPDVPVAIIIAADQGSSYISPFITLHKLTPNPFNQFFQDLFPPPTGPSNVAAKPGTSGKHFRSLVIALLKAFSVFFGQQSLSRRSRSLGAPTHPMTPLPHPSQ
jgi:hypothetical protein